MTPCVRAGIRLAAGIVLATPSLPAQQSPPVEPAKAATIRQILALTQADQLALRGMEVSIPAQRAANPQIPAQFWDAFLSRARADVGGLVDLLIPIYAAHFSQVQLEQLLQFYRTPLGQHLAEVQPAIAQESILAGQRWGASLGKAVAESLAQQGVRMPSR
ncbi:MAG TPA: DUF2059 domain-containing protein [Gemmatimonadales bacterium]|nr:DUF2059 domain-containing protein [Gemmatimonadales bacterium]